MRIPNLKQLPPIALADEGGCWEQRGGWLLQGQKKEEPIFFVFIVLVAREFAPAAALPTAGCLPSSHKPGSLYRVAQR